MNPSSPNTDNSQGGPETARNPYAQGNSFDRPGAMKPIMSQPDQPAQPIPQQPIMGRAGGNIVLQPEPPKKSKKPLIIIVLIMIFGVAITLFLLSEKSVLNFSMSSGPSQDKFNLYANYILYNQESIDEPNESLVYDPYSDSKASKDEFQEEDSENYYRIDYIIESAAEDEKAIFFEKAQSLFKDFLGSIENDKILSDAKNYNEKLEFLALYVKAPKLNELDVIDKYNNTSLDSTKDFIKKSYEPFIQSDSITAQKYAKDMISSYESYAKILDWLKSKGCFENNTIDNTCAKQNNFDSLMQDDLRNFDEKNASSTQLIPEVRKALIKSCWELGAETNLGRNG